MYPKSGTNIIAVLRPWHIFSFAYRWRGEKRVHSHSIADYPTFDKDIHDDKLLCKDLWSVMDQADFVLAHNGDRFDIKKIRTRFLVHRFPVYSPLTSIDSLKIAKKYFAFDSNRADAIGSDLSVGRKLETKSRLWLRCYAGERAAFGELKKYNEQDVRLLADIYGPMAPWHATHPNITGDYSHGKCPACASPRVTKQGPKMTRAGKKQQYKCGGCGHWWTDTKVMKGAAA